MNGMRKQTKIRTIADLNAFNAVQNARQREYFLRAMSIDYVAKQTALQFKIYAEEPKSKKPCDALALIRSMPQFAVVAVKAFDDLGDRKHAFQQSSRASKPRKKTYRIGPEVLYGVKEPFRLTRSFQGYVTEFVRSRLMPKVRARSVWKELGFELQNGEELFSNFANRPHRIDPRQDIYLVAIGRHSEKISYIDFERCFAAAKKPQAFVG